jgi:hypothetical protein
MRDIVAFLDPARVIGSPAAASHWPAVARVDGEERRRYRSGMLRVLALLVLSTVPAFAREAPRRPPCPGDAPPGVRLPDRPGCREREAAPATRPGFLDLGGGSSVRVGGRVRGEVEMRR